MRSVPCRWAAPAPAVRAVPVPAASGRAAGRVKRAARDAAADRAVAGPELAERRSPSDTRSALLTCRSRRRSASWPRPSSARPRARQLGHAASVLVRMWHGFRTRRASRTSDDPCTAPLPGDTRSQTEAARARVERAMLRAGCPGRAFIPHVSRERTVDVVPAGLAAFPASCGGPTRCWAVSARCRPALRAGRRFLLLSRRRTTRS